MSKQHYALIGHPIEHTMSPFIHKRLFELSHINAEYKAINVNPDDLKRVFFDLKNLNGFNITIPHKQKIIPFLDSLSKKSHMCQSVNTVKNTDISKGYTTDPAGFLKALEYAKIDVAGRVVIIGAGGVATAIAYECALRGCQVVIVSRPSNLSSAAELAGKIKNDIEFSQVETCTTQTIKGHIDLLVNATPVGMYPKNYECPVFTDIICKSEAVFDAVYNPKDTIFLKTARENNIKSVGGMPMLIWQAVESHKIWNDAEFNHDDILQLEEDTQKELKKLFGGDRYI